MRYANVLIKTYSPEAMCGAIESPETCGMRMKNAAIKSVRIASCNARFANERHGSDRATNRYVRGV